MAWITDSLTAAIAFASRCNPFASAQTGSILPNAFTHQLAMAAYLSSGMMRKVIAIPAADRTQKWRDWQADKDTIALIEAEEKRLGLRAKTKQAELLRGIGGGAKIMVTAGNHSSPLTAEQVSEGGLIAVNVVSRWEITATDFDRNLASPTYRQPRMFRISDGTSQQDIHPSRVVCYRGEPLPAGGAVSDEDAFWGDSRLLRVFQQVQHSEHAQLWFVDLVKKAKLLRIGIPDLLDMVGTTSGQAQLDARIALIATGESTLNATVYRSGTGPDDPGEKIDDYQVTWTGIPEFMDALDQRVAAVADIPFTRLMGRSPAGMNATGQHDTDNWNDAVADGQENETRPCLEQIDPLLLRSAGVSKPDDVTWRWAPLWTPTEKEEADTFFVTMQAVEKLQNTGAIPEEAFSEGLQNLMEEREYMPGLGAALAKIPEAERFGISQEPDPNAPDPSALQAANENEVGKMQKRGAITGDQARALLTDARPRSLYVRRDVVNVAEIAAWAKEQGIPDLRDDLHVTIIYSRQPMDWMKAGNASDWGDKDGRLTIAPGGPRAIEPLGDMSAVLLFASSELGWRHLSIVEAGASHDYDGYVPHISLTKAELDVEAIEPYRGKIVLGPEIFEELEEEA